MAEVAEPIFKQAEKSELKIIRKNGQDIAPTEPTTPTPTLKEEEDEPEVPVTPSPPEEVVTPLTDTPPAETPAVETPPIDVPPAPPPADQPQGLTPEEQKVMDGFLDYTSEQTGGKINSVEEILNLATEVEQLRAQLAEKPKIEFPNDQAKAIYEYACKFPGLEKTAARNYLHVMSLDVKNMSDKEKQFEAFSLKYPKYSRDEAREFFDAQYEKDYGNGILEEDKTAKFSHRVKTDEAESTIQKMQEEFEKMSSKPADTTQKTTQLSAEDQRLIEQGVSGVLEEFEGIKYRFYDNDPQSEVVVPMDKNEVKKFETLLRNPNQFVNDVLEECYDGKGNFNWDQYALTMFEFKNRNKIREQAFNAGVTYGEAKKIKALKNAATPRPADVTPPKKEPKSLGEAMVLAVRAARKK